MVIAMVYLCMQMMKGNWLCLMVIVLPKIKRQKEGKQFLMKKV